MEIKCPICNHEIEKFGESDRYIIYKCKNCDTKMSIPKNNSFTTNGNKRT